MQDTEELSCSLPLPYTYTTSTVIEPEKRGDFFLPYFDHFFFFSDCFHGAHYSYFREN